MTRSEKSSPPSWTACDLEPPDFEVLRFFALIAVTLLSCNPQRQDASSPMTEKPKFDLRIIHGEVIDGTGAPRKRADVGIRGDTIVEIGDLSDSTAAVTIDAAG